MPSEAAKKASTCLIKCCSLSVSVSQSLRSCARSTSSAVQNDASAFLYMTHRSWCLIGKMTKRDGLGRSIGSAASISAGVSAKAMAGAGRRAGDLPSLVGGTPQGGKLAVALAPLATPPVPPP